MATEWVYRILLLYPESLRIGVEAWYASEWPDAGDLLTPCGTKNGESWYVSSFVAKRADVERWLAVFAESVGQAAPEELLDAPRDYQRITMLQMANAAQQTLGFIFRGCFNDEGEMIDHRPLMEAEGIVPLASGGE